MIPDWGQFRTLFSSQLLLDFRRPRAGGGALRQREVSTRTRMIWSFLIYLFLSAMVGALAPGAHDRRTYAALVLGFTLTLLVMLVLTEFAVSVMQGEDLVVLGPRPVTEVTYTWAKLASLAVYVGFYGLAASSFPILMGFLVPDGGAAFVGLLALMVPAGLLAATGGVLALYGFVLGRMRLEKARDLLNWVTIVFSILVPVSVLLLRGWMDRSGLSISLDLERHAWMAWLPPMWLAGLVDFLLGARDPLTRHLALEASVLMCVGFLAGIWALANGVLKLSDRPGASASGPEVATADPPRPDRLAWMRPLLPTTASWGVYRMILAYMARDRGTKARLYPQFGASLAFLAVYAFRKGGDPWMVGGGNAGSWAFVAAYYPAVTCAWLPLLLRFSEQWEAGWTFAVAPGATLADLAAALKRATALALLLPSYLLVWLYFACRWGSPLHATLQVLPPALACLSLMDIALMWRKPIPFACRYMKGEAGTRMAITLTIMTLFTGLGFLQAAMAGNLAFTGWMIAGLFAATVVTDRLMAGYLSGRGVVLADL